MKYFLCKNNYPFDRGSVSHFVRLVYLRRELAHVLNRLSSHNEKHALHLPLLPHHLGFVPKSGLSNIYSAKMPLVWLFMVLHLDSLRLQSGIEV